MTEPYIFYNENTTKPECKSFDARLWSDACFIYSYYGISAKPLYGPHHADDCSKDRKAPLYRANLNAASPELVDKTRKTYPFATPAIMMGENNICVVDVDDIKDLEAVEQICGPTPLKVQTKRGMHLYFKAGCNLRSKSSCSSKFQVDLKAGKNSYVVAPFSKYDDKDRYNIVGQHNDPNCHVCLKEVIETIKTLPILEHTEITALWPEKIRDRKVN